MYVRIYVCDYMGNIEHKTNTDEHQILSTIPEKPFLYIF